MAKYKVKEGRKFGLLGAGTEIELTPEEAAPHLRNIELVSSDFQNTAGAVVPEKDKLLSSEGKPNYAALTVADLRAELAVRDLETDGVKAELIARLEQSDEDNK